MQLNPSDRLRCFLFRFVFCFVLLFIFSLPFPYNLLPDIGKWISLLWNPLVRFTAENIFNITSPCTLEIISDSTGMYLQTLLIFFFSLTGALIWSVLNKEIPQRLPYLVQLLCAYYLSLQLFKYGFDKLFKYQFYLPEPNTLYTNVGDLSKDILYWSAIGSSYSYSVFLGLTELIPAVLLLFRKTRFIGALLACMVMVNVVMINFSFDISVKLYSCFLLLLSGIVAAPGLFKLYYAFQNNAWKAGSHPVFFHTQHKRLIYTTIKTGVIGLILVESIYGYIKSGIYNDDTAQRPYLHGAWKVLSHVVEKDTLDCSSPHYIKNFFIHRKGYFIIQNQNNALKDYKLSTSGIYFKLTDYDSTTIRFRFQENKNTLTLQNERITINAVKNDLSTLPLLQGDFHWTIDEY